MGFHKDLRVALVSIANGDTVANDGLVALTGSTNPLWYYGNHKDKELPVTTFILLPSEQGTVSGKSTVRVRFITWTAPAVGSTYIEKGEDIRDRFEAIMTNANLAGRGVDAAPMAPSRRDLASSDDKGVIGLVLEIEFFNGA